MKTIYISGQITGLNIKDAHQLFEIAENDLKELGLTVVNPTKLEHNHGKTWAEYMKEDIKALCDCDSIYMLHNWKKSTGANIEHALAKDLGLKVIYQQSSLVY